MLKILLKTIKLGGFLLVESMLPQEIILLQDITHSHQDLPNCRCCNLDILVHFSSKGSDTSFLFKNTHNFAESQSF